MANNWTLQRLRDVVEIYDGPHATPRKTDDGPIFLGISNLSGGRIDFSEVEHLSEGDFERWTRRVTPTAGDIVFSYETRLGEAALIPNGFRGCLGRRMGLMRSRGDVNPRFLLYTYLGPEFQETIRARTIHGSTVDRIPLIEMPDFPVRIPDRQTQDGVASVLGALDNKIELNRKMSATLEATARALFNSWFVAFDSVPRTRLESSETGFVPSGWVVSKVGLRLTTVLGGTPSRERPDYWENGTIAWINSGKTNEFRITTATSYITEDGLHHSAAKVLPPRTTVLAITGATLGQVSLLEIEAAANQSVVGILGTEEIPSEFIYFWTRLHIDDLLKRQTGGAQQHVNKNDVNALPLLIPPANVLDSYVETVRPMFDRIKAALAESATLRHIRDALLPKLLSGDLRVRDTERILETSA